MSAHKGHMKTPPSSPMMESSSTDDDGPPSLMESTSLSASPGNAPKSTPADATSDAANKMDTSPRTCSSPARGHARTATPSTPVQMDEDAYVVPQGRGAPSLFSTPGRSGPGGGTGPAAKGCHLPSDLTPVTSNSGGTYVDAHLGRNKPGMPGLAAPVGGQGMSAVVTPAGAAFGRRPSRELRQRSHQRPFPPPRAGLPPARAAGGAASIVRPPSAASSDASQLRRSPSTPSDDVPRGILESEESDGLAGLLMGEGLAMPSYELEDSSSLDTSGSSGRGRPSSGTASASIFQAKEGAAGLAPIELRPDRKFFSFQGSREYRQSVAEEGGPTQMEAIPSAAVPAGNEAQEAQYQPFLRGQHGVTEMADAQDLDAIFNTEGQPPIDQPYPVDDRQFSIPSIRLANHVHSLTRPGYPLDRGHSYQSEYTYEDDVSLEESCYSFLGDDDDASLSSRGSVDVGARKRRISLHMVQLQRAASVASLGEAASESRVPTTIRPAEGSAGPSAVGSAGPSAVVSPPPAIAPSNSFLEKVQGISLGGAFEASASAAVGDVLLPQRAHTFDSEAPPLAGGDAAPRSSHTDDDDVDNSRRRRRQRRHQKKEGAAARWLADLQSRSHGGNGGTDVLIVEAASSKFLAGEAEGWGSDAKLGAEALGMPHPLCRSSTIEAGPFVRRSGEVALTSSGSGD